MRRFRSLELGLGISLPAKSKMGNKRTEYNGVTYDSKSESRHAMWLDSECQQHGYYAWWIRQPKFRLGVPENIYVPDFLVVRNEFTNSVLNEAVEVHEVKGHRTAKFKHDLKLWRQYGPCQLRIYTKGVLDEVIYPIDHGDHKQEVVE